MKRIALIPARSGSQRIPKKNLVLLEGHPLIAYSISAALSCEGISRVIVSTDCEEIREVSLRYGAEVPGLRPTNLAKPESPDIDWIKHSIQSWLELSLEDVLVILRPTNPLRTSEVISNALKNLSDVSEWDSLRAVREIKEHPRKMWQKRGIYIQPYLPEINAITGTDSHSSPMQTLERFLVQDASLEICKVSTVKILNSISGDKVIPYEMPGYQGFDLNYPADLDYLYFLIQSGRVQLPQISMRKG